MIIIILLILKQLVNRTQDIFAREQLQSGVIQLHTVPVH